MTDIEWTDETWNPTDGCEVCSPGCASCYAMRFAGRFAKPGERYHGLVTIGKNKRAVWTGEARLDAGKLAKPLHWKKPRRIFVNSMSDLFYEGFTNEQIAAVYGVMAACPQHTFQILTKRAQRRREWFAWVMANVGPRSGAETEFLIGHLLDEAPDVIGDRIVQGQQFPLRNVWEGVSAENQDAADERIPELQRTPAALRFLSCEPLLGGLDLTRVAPDSIWHSDALAGESRYPICNKWKGIDWVIAGCESGPGARSCAVSWLRSLRDQCSEAQVPFFLKQAHPWTWATGSKPPGHKDDSGDGAISFGPGSKRKAGGVIGLPYLDGVQHKAFPKEMTP